MRLAEQLLRRIVDHPRAPGLRDSITSAGRILDRFAEHVERINADENLTPAGQKAAVADAIRRTYGPAVSKEMGAIIDGRKASAAARAKLSLPAPDPADIAGALERQEIRAMVRGMKPTQRIAYLLAEADERIADAVLTAPARLSGLDDRAIAEVRDAALARRFGAEASEAAEIESAVAEADAALTVLKDELAKFSGLSPEEYADATSGTKPGGIPWLWNDGDKVRRIIRGKNGWEHPVATAEEIATGKFYANQQAYEADNGGVASQ